MIKMLELRELIKLISQSSIEELNLKNKGIRIFLKKPPVVVAATAAVDVADHAAGDVAEQMQTAFLEAAAAVDVAPSEPASAAPSLQTIVAPAVGIFAASTESGVKVGGKVTAGQVVGHCSVDALKIVHEVKSNWSGEIVDILAEEGQLVVYGQPLFLVKPE